MNAEEIKRQSENAYNQWCDKWRTHCAIHSKFEMLSMNDLWGKGIGKSILCIANGYSFERDSEFIKKNQHKFDIICCDKTLGNCLDNGIIPKYCMVCDAVVDYEKYMKPWKDQLSKVTLLMNSCGNPLWAQNGTWRNKYFFVNKDILGSEKEFCKISGCPNVIPAGTNVSNAMVVILTQCDEKGYNNFFGYDKILLSGFDYCWSDGKYYAFDGEAGGKNNYMRHIYTSNREDKYCFTSNNLMFSARWLHKYVETFKLPVVQCSKDTILTLNRNGSIEDHAGYNFKRGDSAMVRNMAKKKNDFINEIKKIDCIMKDVGSDHANAFLATV